MTSVQENKNELEAAVRYCESAITRAKQTIESMEFRQEMARKSWHEQTGREKALQREVRELRERVNLRDDQIAMLERRLAKYTGEKTYPFKEGDLYYVFNQLDGTWIESVWDDESERIHDSTDLPDRPHKVYFSIDQKHVLDKFKPEDD